MVGLKALDSCYMKGVVPLGIEFTVYPLEEFTFAVFDRELRKIFDNPTVQPRKFCDEIVESRAEMICSFSYKDSYSDRNNHSMDIKFKPILVPMPNCEVTNPALK